ncbi:hypothetical protein ACIA49_13445 [Kribbella sp. NPDC051587]|uniref:hypothetical protein n=1 Tax=Kribbella sp. NPDC051587 TaxID=3364119 RepID=UPI0037B66312
MTDNDGNESILGQIQPYEWDDQQAISFEVAQDTISLFIAHCTDRYWTERRKETPDQSVMDHWDEQSRLASIDRHALRADDPEAIRAVRDSYGQRLRELNGRADG